MEVITKNTQYAPVVLPTYVRLSHLVKTISALKSNYLADCSDIFIFSDGPKSGDEAKVAALRSYLRTISGFRSVNIIERDNNCFSENTYGGLKQIVNEYGRVIFLEEDVVTAKGFLTFMNEALEYYEGNDEVFSIAGYAPPIGLPRDYKKDYYFLRRFSAWGFGIWKNRLDLINQISPLEYDHLMRNKKELNRFVDHGNDMIRLLKLEAYGKLDAFDVRAMYSQYKNNMYTLYPRLSLTLNIGHDGTGLHCKESNRFDTVLWNKINNYHFDDHVFIDESIKKANKRFRDGRSILAKKILKYTGIKSLNKRLKNSGWKI